MSRRRASAEPTLLTVKDAALLLGVAEATLRRWDESGKFRAHRHPMNGYRLYREADLLRLKRRIDGSTGGEER